MKTAFCVLIVAFTSGLALAQDEVKQPPKPPAYRLVICQTVASDQCKRLHDLLLSEYGYAEENIAVFGVQEQLAPVPCKAPIKANVAEHLEKLSKEMGEKDHLVVVFACHMLEGNLIGNQLGYAELNALLAKFEKGVEITVIIEGCHSGWAIPSLASADRIYAACGPMQKCYGLFLSLMIDALSSKNKAFQQADTDLDGRISLGEACDYASNRERLHENHAKLSPKVWPKGWVAYPDKGKNPDEYRTFIGKTKPASKPVQDVSPAVRKELSSLDCRNKKEVIRILSQKEKEIQEVLDRTDKKLKPFLTQAASNPPR